MERGDAGPAGKPGLAKKGDWVQIYGVVLGPGERAPQVPEDTQKVPLEMRLKGFIQHDALVGEEATIKTLTGRLVSGQLVAINPAYEHNFGKPAPELAGVGLELRAMLQDGGDRA